MSLQSADPRIITTWSLAAATGSLLTGPSERQSFVWSVTPAVPLPLF
jgi:hypothetical protein